MKKIYIGFAFAHHKNSQGGYHHIKEYLKYDTIIDAQWEKEFFESTSTNLLLKAIRRAYIYILGHGTPLSVIRCILFALFRRNQVFHFIYAENTYKWLHHFKGQTNKIVCTFHQPASYFIGDPKWLNRLKLIDSVILMTEKDVILFKEWTGKDNVFFIPHGVNTDFFFFNPLVTKDQSVLMVGNWLRDFELARSIFLTLNKEMPTLKIRIVTSSHNYCFFEDINCELYTNIPDFELRNLYQKSSIVFFPLIKYTANNAILEAASCGCNIIITSKSKFADKSYFDNKYVDYLTNRDERTIVESILIKTIKYDTKISTSIYDYVKVNFSWYRIGKLTDQVLCRL
jgi:hypothetical protein